MINKIICILLLILFFILIYLTIIEIKNRKNNLNVENFKLYETNNIEHFETKSWTTDQKELDAMNKVLSPEQKKQVENMINSKTQEKVNTMIVNQKAMFEGPSGPIGPPGPSGGEYISSGRLINKEHSIDSNTNEISYNVTRAQGENESGKTYLETKDIFSPVQEWYFYKDGTIKNRFDDKCLTTKNIENSDLYMSECVDDDINQKWEWEKKTNRIISKNKEAEKNFERCISLSKLKLDENTNLLAGCGNNKNCNNNKRFLKIKNCNQSVSPDEIWSFI